MNGLVDDVKQAFRNLRRSLNLWVSGAVVLALGVGATTAIFALIDTVVLRPRDFRPSDSLDVWPALGVTRGERSCRTAL